MQIRPITENELEASRALCYVAFEFNIDGAPTPASSAQKIITTPQTRMKQQYQDTLAAFDEDGSMVACVSPCTLDTQLDGNIVQLMGVGDVAALPCCQGKGVMKQLFSRLLHDAYDHSIELSYLYPFSGSYYRQFGYSYCLRTVMWRLRLSLLPKFSTHGTVKLYNPTFLADIKCIYRKFTTSFNLAIQREDIEWYSVIGQYDPCVDRVFTYVYYSSEGVAEGYMTYRKQDALGGSEMYCTQFAYTCREGLMGLLDFARSRQAYHEYVTITLPDNIRLELLLPEFDMSPATKSIIGAAMRGMVRVVHLPNAVRAARFVGDGDVTIAISDSYLTQNAGVWQLSWRGGQCTELQRLAQTHADLCMGIDLFSNLLCKGILPEDIPLLPAEAVGSDSSLLLRLFPHKSVGIFEYF
ncbi:MAG: GNAT family N-acetyltransferase [Angelakisella sp.]